MNLAEFSRLNHDRMHTTYAPAHGIGALVLCIQEEVGELAAAYLGATGEKKRKSHLTIDDVADAIADIVTYCDLLATEIGKPLDTLLPTVFNEVSKRTGYQGIVQP